MEADTASWDRQPMITGFLESAFFMASTITSFSPNFSAAIAAAFSLLVLAVAFTAPVLSSGTPESKPITGMSFAAHSSSISVTASVERAASAIALGFFAISFLTMLT